MKRQTIHYTVQFLILALFTIAVAFPAIVSLSLWGEPIRHFARSHRWGACLLVAAFILAGMLSYRLFCNIAIRIFYPHLIDSKKKK